MSSGAGSRLLVPLSGAVLVLVTMFGLLPELRLEIGWPSTLLLAAAGFLTLLLLDKMGLAVCPSCQHGTGTGRWLAFAVGVHAFVDGWAMAAAGSASLTGAMLLHKIPEGLAVGGMTRSLAMLAAAESMTVAGGMLGLWSPPGALVAYPLAVASGTFLFLGIHAVVGDNRL